MIRNIMTMISDFALLYIMYWYFILGSEGAGVFLLVGFWIMSSLQFLHYRVINTVEDNHKLFDKIREIHSERSTFMVWWDKITDGIHIAILLIPFGWVWTALAYAITKLMYHHANAKVFRTKTQEE